MRDYDPTTGRYLQADPLGLVDGPSVYGYVSNSPLRGIDRTGLLEDFVMVLNSQRETTLSCSCGDTFPAFSGAEGAFNDPTLAAAKNIGPIPPRRYYIVDRPTGGRLGWLRELYLGRSDWYALYAYDDSIDDFTDIRGTIRGQFRLHAGSRSEGCVTLTSDDAFSRLRNLLENTESAIIPGTNIKHYGTITVVVPPGNL